MRRTSNSLPLTPLTVKRRTIQRHGTLLCDEPCKLLGHTQGKTNSIALVFTLDDFRHRVDMAGDKMAAHLVTELQRALKIDARSGLPASNGGKPQRFFPGLDLEPAGIRSSFREGS